VYRLLLALPFVLTSAALAQRPAPAATKDPIPVDSAVTIGRLPNGLRYYIRENHRPEKRAELRLVVNAGSILEDPDQLGLAHFVEHMAFNGTEHFQKQELVDYIERIGMRFGADLNAYTSFDETVYQLVVPTDTAQLLTQGIQILEDWAHGISFDSAEVRKERGVVIEEWRLGQGAGQRLRKQQFPVLFRGSRYAERLPIGTKQSLEGFSPAALRRFYRDWYRPDLMAVIAVGDFDRKAVEQLIRQHFSRIPARKAPRPRPRYGVPPRPAAAAAIATDREATGTRVNVHFIRPARPRGTVSAYRASLVAGLYSQMLDTRLSELAQKPNPPFLGAGSGTAPLVRSADAFSLGLAVPDTGVRRGLDAVLTEVERVERHGFTAPELARAKRSVLRRLEQSYAERDKAESGDLVDEYVEHFLTGEAIPGIAREFELAKQLLPGIGVAEVDHAAREWLGLKDRVVLVSAPEKSGLVVPKSDSLLALFGEVQRRDVPAYEETVSEAPLVTAELPEADIVGEAHDSAVNTTTWTLANGVRVILKPTDFKADQVLLGAYSPGGTSLVPDSLFLAARVATDAVGSGGLGQFGAVELQKKLAGIAAGVEPYIDTYEEGLSGGASPADLRTLFELVYLQFAAPRADSAAFQAFRTNVHAALVNRGASPAAAFQDTLGAALAQHHPRSRPFTAASVDSLDLGQAMAVYRDRFANAGDFTFVLVGSFTLDSVRPLVRRYLGNLPAAGRREEARDIGLAPPPGVVEREVHKGIEPKSQTAIVFTGPFDYTTAERSALSGLAQLLELKLREQLREEMGGTYGVSVRAAPSRVPRPQYSLSIQFGSSPERAGELVGAIFAQIDSLRHTGGGEMDLAKLREKAIRTRETELRENGFWLRQIAFADQSGEHLDQVLDLQKLLAQLTRERLRLAAQQYLDVKRYVRVTLLPEASPAIPHSE
jgi:zinc protease